jgi:Na+/phosphate symporter
MRFMGVLALLCGLVLCGAAAAQESGEVEDAMQLTRQMIQTERQTIVAANMDLTEAESQAFWPLYREYRGEMAKVGDRSAALITDYAKNYETMTDLQAEAMIKEAQEIAKKQVSVREDYMKKLKKILPPKKVARFYQIENKLDAVISYELTQEIPLVKTK